MALSIGSSLELLSTAPNFTRDLFNTISEMKNYDNTNIPELFITLNKEDGNLYCYNFSNSIDPTLGRWRPFFNSQVKTINKDLNNGSIVQYIGETNENYTCGHFYKLTITKDTKDISVEKTAGSKLSAIIKDSSKLVFSQSGVFEFVCLTGTSTGEVTWSLNSELVDISSYGISVSGKTINTGDKVIVNFTLGSVIATEVPVGGSGGTSDYNDLTNKPLALSDGSVVVNENYTDFFAGLGLKGVKMTAAEYEALETKDDNTLYFVS